MADWLDEADVNCCLRTAGVLALIVAVGLIAAAFAFGWMARP